MGAYYSTHDINIVCYIDYALERCINKSNKLYESMEPILRGKYVIKNHANKVFFRVSGPNSLYGLNVSIPVHANENLSDDVYVIETSLWDMHKKRTVFIEEFKYATFNVINVNELLDEIRRVYNINLIHGLTLVPDESVPAVTFIDSINWNSTKCDMVSF
jgi:hypothetical protein